MKTRTLFCMALVLLISMQVPVPGNASGETLEIPNGSFEGSVIGQFNDNNIYGYHDIPESMRVPSRCDVWSGGICFPLANVEIISGHGNVLYLDTPEVDGTQSKILLVTSEINVPIDVKNLQITFKTGKNANNGDPNRMQVWIVDVVNIVDLASYDVIIYPDGQWITHSINVPNPVAGKTIEIQMLMSGYGNYCAFFYLDAISATYVSDPPTGTVMGYVKEQCEEQTPIPEATVVIEGTGFSTTTDASGYYIMENIPSGIHVMTASKPGFYSVTDPEVNIQKDVCISKGFALTRFQPPTAIITSIMPNPSEQGNVVWFNGNGEDSDGYIDYYIWTSSIDGDLSYSESFSSSYLSPGVHTISFKVRDNHGQYSEPASSTLTIKPLPPTLYNPGEIDDDGAYEVMWCSVIGAWSYTLEEDTTPCFCAPTVIYSGNSLSKDIGGKTDGEYYYRVRASTGGADSSWSNIEDITVDISINKPTLSAATVNPFSGNSSTVYTYEVIYQDPDDDPPGSKLIYIDGEPHSMEFIEGSWDTGARFKYTTILQDGNHEYYFHFDDDHGNEARLPTAGCYRGPNVITINPEDEIAILVVGTIFQDSILDRFVTDMIHVYNTLLKRGLTKENIYFMAPYSFDADSNGFLDDIDSVSSSSNLEYAITNWALNKTNSDTHLLLFLRDHGSSFGFSINEFDDVTPSTLRSWLATLKTHTGLDNITFIVSSCHAGLHISSISDVNTICIAKSPAWSVAYGGFDIPFSQKIREGENILDAYEYAKGVYESLYAHLINDGTIGGPEIEDSGDGVPNQVDDGLIASNRYIGFGNAESNAPVISLPYEYAYVSEGSLYTINVTIVDNGSIDEAFAEIITPEFVFPKNESYHLPIVPLSRIGDSNYFEGFYDLDENLLGEYRVIVWGRDTDGNYGHPALSIVNASTDFDRDGEADPVDEDDDGDGILDEEDEFPFNASEWQDLDEDGIGDNADQDDDNDGYNDTTEELEGSDPLNHSSTPADYDRDYIPDSTDPYPFIPLNLSEALDVRIDDINNTINRIMAEIKDIESLLATYNISGLYYTVNNLNKTLNFQLKGLADILNNITGFNESLIINYIELVNTSLQEEIQSSILEIKENITWIKGFFELLETNSSSQRDTLNTTLKAFMDLISSEYVLTSDELMSMLNNLSTFLQSSMTKDVPSSNSSNGQNLNDSSNKEVEPKDSDTNNEILGSLIHHMKVSKTTVNVNEILVFNVTVSSGHYVTGYYFDLADGETIWISQGTISYAYTEPGYYLVKSRVRSRTGQESLNQTILISVEEQETPSSQSDEEIVSAEEEEPSNYDAQQDTDPPSIPIGLFLLLCAIMAVIIVLVFIALRWRKTP